MVAREPKDLAGDWTLSGLMLAAIGVALASLNSILADVAWWFIVMLVATVVLAAGALVRSFARSRYWGTLAAFVAAVASITLMFAPADALLGVIPTPEVFGRLRELEQLGSASIANQGVPANADQGIVYLLCLGAAAIAFVMDTLAFSAKTPALAGLPLLLLVMVPSLVDPALSDGFFFALVAAAYLGMLLVRSRPAGRRAAIGIGSAAVVAALVVPLALPPLTPSVAEGQSGDSSSTGINPILSLGDDLRRGDPSLAFTYSTTSESTTGEYFRLTALDDFSGASWEPSTIEVIPGNDVDAIGAPAGLGADVPVTEVTSEVGIASILTRWLPAPYAPTSVQGLDGVWSWEPDGLAIRTDSSNARDQQYTVQSLDIAPSIEQLLAAATTVEAGLDRYLELPTDLPAVVGATAIEVIGDADTFYEQALALQDFFRNGEFAYSEQAPVEDGYDGSGASVLARFLEEKSGYCVHFSSAMAAMARTLGIPARVAVGFTPGDKAQVDGGIEFRVTTYNLHAWPELFFAGIGWVRFEPTPGRGDVPAFAPLAADDPATPDVDESQPVPVSTPTAVPTDQPDPADTPEGTSTPTPSPVAVGPGVAGTAPGLSIGLGVLLLLLVTPAIVRLARRERRLAAVARGSGAAAWAELRDRVHDLGGQTTVARTPRQFSADLSGRLDDDGAAALARLRDALESEAFAEVPGDPDPDDVRTVSRSLGRSAGFAARLVALLAPRSLVAAWLPAVAPPDV